VFIDALASRVLKKSPEKLLVFRLFV